MGVFDLLHTMPVSTVKAFGHTRWQGTPLDFDNDFDGIVEAFMEIETNITGADVQEAEVRLFRDNTQIAAIQFTNHGIDVFRTGDISAELTSGTYSVETEVTQATNQYQSAVFYNVRLVVIQRNPTKTVLEFPLSIGGKGFWVSAQGWGWSVNQYNDYEHNTFDHAYYPYGSYPRFMTGFPYTAANFDGIDAIEFVVYAQNEDYGSYGTDMEFRLFNHTDGTPVSGTLIQAPANTFARYSVSLGATDLADGKFYRVQGRTVSFESGKDGDIQGAFLYFKLNNFTKAEVHFPIDFKLTGDSGKGWNSWYGRALFNPDWYSTDSIRFRGWVTKMLIHDPNSLLVGPYGGTAYAGSGIAPVTDGGDESTGYYELKTSGPLDLSELIEAVHGIYQPDGANSTSAGHKVLVISGRMGAGSGGEPPSGFLEGIALLAKATCSLGGGVVQFSPPLTLLADVWQEVVLVSGQGTLREILGLFGLVSGQTMPGGVSGALDFRVTVDGGTAHLLPMTSGLDAYKGVWWNEPTISGAPQVFGRPHRLFPKARFSNLLHVELKLN